MKINDLKTAKKPRVKEAIDPALSFEQDDPEFAAKKRGMGYFDYSTLKREDFNDDDWYVWDPEQQQFVASYGARSSTALDFRMRESFSGTYKMPDGRIAMRGMRAKFMPGIESRNNDNLDEAAKTLQMIESWEEFKETVPALKEVRRRQANSSVREATGDPKFDKMLKGITGKRQVAKQQKADTKQQARDAFGGMFGGGNPTDKLSIRKKGMAEGKKKRKKKSSTALSRYFFPGYGYYGGGESGEGGGEGGGESINSRMAETRKSDFRNTVEQQALAAVERIKNSDYPDVIKQYLIAITDPSGPVFKAAYHSYPKGNEARDRIKDIFAQKYNVDPDELEKADLDYIATQLTEVDDLDENLRDWFKDKWVRFGPDGKIRGDCARGSESEGKPKCLPQSKAHALGKKGRASAAARKRREDPNANRTGAAINVATKKKTNEVQLDEKCWDTYKQVGMKKKGSRMVPNCVPKESQEQSQQCPECGGSMYPETMLNEKKDACYYKVKASAKVWPSAYASGRLVQCRKRGASNYGKKSESVAEDTLDEKWSKKYKSSIDCSNPKGFSQRAHCAGRKKNEDVTEDNTAALKTIRGPHGKLDVDRSEKGVTKVKRQNWKQSGGATVSGGYGVGVPQSTKFSSVDTERNANRRRLRLDRDEVSEESDISNDELFGPRAVTGTLLDRQALNVANKLTTDKNLAKLNDMAHDSAIYRALERYFVKNNISTTIFNRVAAIVFKKLDKYGRRLSTDPRTQEQGVAEGTDDIAQAKERLSYLEKIFDTSYEYSDDHSVWKKNHAIEQEIRKLKKIIGQDGIAEAEDNKDAAAAKKPGFIDNVKQGAEDYKDLWMMGATGRTPERWKTSAEKAAERGSAPGPQFPLKEGRMKEIAIEFQDYKHLPDMAFQSRYKISKRDWWNKHAKLVQGSGLGIGMDEARGKIKAKVVHPRPTRAEREHDRIRKERGLPNPSHYKTLGDKLDKEIAALRGDDTDQ